MFRIIATFLAVLCCSLANARAEASSVADWSSEMLRKLPFTQGVMSAKKYADVSQEYVESMTQFYRQIADNKIQTARKNGRGNIVGRLERKRDIQIALLMKYARDAERGVLKSLDPHHSGLVTISHARKILLEIANRSDFNRNGLLEGMEADIAEAAFVRGIDAADPLAIDRLVYELDRDESVWRW